MTARIHCVTSSASLGCSFLDWSLLWLSGQSRVFSVDHDGWQPITSDPLGQQLANAHGHCRNHRSGAQQNLAMVQHLQSVTGAGRLSLYPYPLHADLCCRDLGISVADLAQPHTLARVHDYQRCDFINMLSGMHQQGIPVIYVAFDPAVRGHKWQRRNAERLWTQDRRPDSVQQLIDEQQDIFFSHSQARWHELGLTEIWDQRERMALDMRPFDTHWDHDLVLPMPHLWINCQDLWFDTERTVPIMMQWLDLDIDQQRWQQWLPVVAQWRCIHNNALQFPRMLDHVVRCILSGQDLDLPELTLYQEAIIQHCLIYQHGMNLRTWQLIKFPRNTRLLHDLLEPNTHPVTA